MNRTTIQGDFTHTDASERAKLALKQAGIADTRIRTWNILEGSGTDHGNGSAIPTGAVVGGLVAGGPGIVAGAGIGAIVEGGEDTVRHLPDPSGVCVVVDIEADEQQIRTILLSCGATNVHLGPTAR